ncbi:MAG TPA: SDR family NAD(P)-dependent oxidoreductase [Pyrinomonadaceae bacterium]|nr:SDR family NAD(P)-dependent oxidoreductase [Pyrinomonadaceae bacterium]
MITGASSGIGKGLALDLSRRGAIIGLVARRAEALAELVTQIELGQGKAIALVADVNDSGALRTQTDRLRSEFGPIDVLIANAGIGTISPALDLKPQDIADVFNVNVLGAVNSVAAVLPEMIAGDRGQLVAISSLSAYRGLPKSAAYCASKAALSSFFESLRIDLRESKIDVTIIHPGFIKTPLTAGRLARMPYLMELDDAVKKIVRAIEKRRKSYAFPWQLASIVRLGMVMPTFMYDRIAARNSFRE